jgi:hypothetical protein
MAKRRTAKNFSLVALHREFARVERRLNKVDQTPAAKKLRQDLRNASKMLDCDETMLIDLSE